MSTQKPHLLISDSNGKIYDLPYLEATGMKAGHFFRLSPQELIKLPSGSELFMLPGRMPVGYDPQVGRYVKPERCFAVAAFISPGFTATYNSAYAQIKKPAMLPLFSYAAVAFYKGAFYVACLRVDREFRQNLRLMNIDLVRENTKRLRKIFPRNRLIVHLEGCALKYGCPAAKNFFLSRYEAPLPTSRVCNAECMGCISYQAKRQCPVTQPRIRFVPSPEEVAEVALFHIDKARDPVVSFGQGCEGEPLMAEDVLQRSIRMVRGKTSKGMINLNTNASRPKVIARLFDAGLDSIRVSLNSAQIDYYTRYFKPRGYTFVDVMQSIKIAKKKNGFVSVNYLIMPGFTDSRGEIRAFRNFMRTHRIDMIQWRNLNFDPMRYFKSLRVKVSTDEMFGIDNLIKSIKKDFPNVMMGYFNPSKRRIGRRR